MPTIRDPAAELEDRQARLARNWFAEIREKQRVEDEAEAQRRQHRDAGTDGGLWDLLTGDSDSDSDGGSD